jgi:Ca2+-binding RTX toxin-like protein
MRRQAMLVVVAMVGALVVGSGAALAADVLCAANPCLGTRGPDVIEGTDTAETIKAMAGKDIISARGQNDLVYGGEGNDLVDGWPGIDVIYGGPNGDGSAQGTDFNVLNLQGGEDSDFVYGGGGNDFIDAAAHDLPSQNGAAPVDSSFGGSGNDHIYAKDGNKDIIDCGRGTKDVAYIDPGIDTDIKGCETQLGDTM